MTIFKETQRFTQWWLWLILLSALGLPFILFYQEMDEGGEPNMMVILVIFIFGIALLAFFRIMRLRTEIDSEKIFIHFYPIMRKTIHWKDVQSAEVIDYGFVGGWGIRYFTKYGTVFNIKGRKGLALVLKNKKKYLIGTQKKEELEKFFEGNFEFNFQCKVI